jgi:DNA primase
MLTQASIQKIKDVTISSVISNYVADLKKKGTNWQGCCPFHGEKTPSFVVNDTKEIYKCFGCGVSGGVINFVMEHEKQTFYEACKTIAQIANITLEYEEKPQTEEEKKKFKEKFTAEQQQEKVLNYVVPVYQKLLKDLPENHPAKIWLAERKIDDETIALWQIGWGGEEWNTVTTPIINQNLWEPANKLGISKRSQKNDSNYDAYRSRIIFPITDKQGRFIGLGGRYIKCNDNDAYDTPKYINPAESEIYNKSAVLYGLNKAAAAIKEKSCVNVVEGYMDVVSPSRVAMQNVVATCGTAFTTQQAKLLKRYTDHVILMRDNDNAGEESFKKALPVLLKEGFIIEKRIYGYVNDVLIAKDADDWVNKIVLEDDVNAHSTTEDAVLNFAKTIWREDDNPAKKASQKQVILELLSNIPNEIVRNNYLDSITKMLKWNASNTKKEFGKIFEISFTPNQETDEEPQTIQFPSWIKDQDKEAFFKNGYLEVNEKINNKPVVGYLSFGANGKTEITNFVVKPLFRIEAGQDSRYLSEINNGYRQTVVDMPAKIFPSIDQFQGICVAAGGSFLIYGSRAQWLRIATDLLHNYPICFEINFLGWQPSGFFAFINNIFIPQKGTINYDRWGIINHKEQKFFLAAKSEAYSHLENLGSDPFENLRYMINKPSPITFEQWANQMHIVYGQKGLVGVAYAVLSVFRDIVFNVDTNCPHLYGFGEPSSGKSKWAESITALFYYRRPAWNLNSGTDFAFNLYVSTFANAPAHLNEFDIEVIKAEWFQQIKGWFDGEGRVRGKLGSKTSVEIQKIVSTIILTGQKLVTADDNSVVTRSIIEAFGTKEYTDAEKKEYDKLKDWQEAGLTSMLTDLVNLRETFVARYKIMFNELLSEWRKTKTTTTTQINQRIVQNYAHLSTCYTLTSQFFKLSQTVNEFKEYCYSQAVKWSSHIRSSDTLSEFWRTLEFLSSQSQIQEEWDYKVDELMEITLQHPTTKATYTKKFDAPTKVLFLRLNNVHKLFQKTYKMNTGKEAMTIENMLFYFNSRQYFLGNVKSYRFRRFVFDTNEVAKKEGFSTVNRIETNKVKEEKNTSCYAFVYQDLNIDIAKENPADLFNNTNDKNEEESRESPF